MVVVIVMAQRGGLGVGAGDTHGHARTPEHAGLCVYVWWLCVGNTLASLMCLLRHPWAPGAKVGVRI